MELGSIMRGQYAVDAAVATGGGFPEDLLLW